VPPRYAIVETNKMIVDKSDIVVVATRYSIGGARRARVYAETKKKLIVDVEKLKEEGKTSCRFLFL